MNCTSCRSLLCALFSVLFIASYSQHCAGTQAIPSGESNSAMYPGTSELDAIALCALIDEWHRAQREPITRADSTDRPEMIHDMRYGIYVRANGPVPQGALERNQYAEMIPILEEGLRIARELAARKEAVNQYQGRP